MIYDFEFDPATCRYVLVYDEYGYDDTNVLLFRTKAEAVESARDIRDVADRMYLIHVGEWMGDIG